MVVCPDRSQIHRWLIYFMVNPHIHYTMDLWRIRDNSQFELRILSLLPSYKLLQHSTMLQALQPLIHALRDIDQDQPITPHQKDILGWLVSSILAHCPRDNVIDILSREVVRYKGELKGLPLIPTHPRSMWPFYTKGQIRDMFNRFGEDDQQRYMDYFDKAYLKEGRTTNLEYFLRVCPEVFSCYNKLKFQFEDSNDTSILLAEKLYIAIISSAPYGLQYMFSRAVDVFIRGGGPVSWLNDGLGYGSDKFPLIASLAYEMAFDINYIKEANTFPKLTKRCRAPDIYECIMMIAFYQSFGIYANLLGLIPETNFYQKYLDLEDLATGVSKKSVEYIYKKEVQKESGEINKFTAKEELLSESEDEDNFIIEGSKKAQLEQLINQELPGNQIELDEEEKDRGDTYRKIRRAYNNFICIIRPIRSEKEPLAEITHKSVVDLKLKVFDNSHWMTLHSRIGIQLGHENHTFKQLSKLVESVNCVHKLPESGISEERAFKIRVYVQHLMGVFNRKIRTDYRELIKKELTDKEKFLIKMMIRAPWAISKISLEILIRNTKENDRPLRMEEIPLIGLIVVLERIKVSVLLASEAYYNFCQINHI